MNEMVERVTQAIVASRNLPDGCDINWDAFRRDARAAIQAMRTPTPHMVDVGWSLIRGNLRPDEIWPHMIDAALSEAAQ